MGGRLDVPKILTLRNMLKKAVEWGYLHTNPMDKVKQFKEDNQKDWILTHEEETRLLEGCEKSPQKKGNKYLKDLVRFALNSGMREAEIFGMKKQTVHVTDKYVVATDTKTHKSRNVPMNDTALEILEGRLKDPRSEYVFFNSRGGRITVLTNAFWYAVEQRAKLVRWEDNDKGKPKKIRFRFHDLRHTFGSRLGMKGADLKTIMEIMGHETPRTAMRYQHPTPDHKLDAVKSLDRAVERRTPSNIVKLKKEAKSSG